MWTFWKEVMNVIFSHFHVFFLCFFLHGSIVEYFRWKQHRMHAPFRTGRWSGPLVASGDWAPRSHWWLGHRGRLIPSRPARCQWTQDVFILDISQNPPNFLHTVRREPGRNGCIETSNDSPDRRTCIKGDAVDRCWWYSSWCFCRLKWAPKLCLTWPSHRMQQLTSLLATSFWECCSLAHETKTTSPSFFTKERLKRKEYVHRTRFFYSFWIVDDDQIAPLLVSLYCSLCSMCLSDQFPLRCHFAILTEFCRSISWWHTVTALPPWLLRHVERTYILDKRDGKHAHIVPLLGFTRFIL